MRNRTRGELNLGGDLNLEGLNLEGLNRMPEGAEKPESGVWASGKVPNWGRSRKAPQ